MFRTNTDRGFTLIELLVVIAIIGILSSVVLASLNSARERSRDTRRVADLKQIQLALELHYDAEGSYPAASDGAVPSSVEDDGYISVIPTDPSDNTVSYEYADIDDGSNYVLAAELEGSNSALDTDIDGTVGGIECDDTEDGGTYCVQP